MTSRTVSAHLAHATRARILDALAKTLEVGMPADRALSSAQDLADRRSAACLGECVTAVRGGAPLARVLARAGLVTGNDAALLEAGERAGAAPRVLAALAGRYERLHAHGQRLRARLALPGAVLVIGVLTLPLPRLASGAIGAAEYLVQTLCAAAALGLAGLLAARLSRTLTRGAQPAGCERWPLLGGWLGAAARVTVLEQLQMLLEAGVAAHDAVRVCRRNASGGLARDWLARLGRRLDAGDPLTTAMTASGLLGEAGEAALLGSAEAAGRSDSMLARLVDAARARLDDRVAGIARWMPPVVYALVVAGLAASYLVG